MPSTGKLKGQAIGVYSGTTLIEKAQTGTLELSGDEIDASTKDDNEWGDILTGTKSASISMDAVYAPDATYGYSQLFAAFLAGTSLTLNFSTNVTGDKYYTGNFVVTSLSMNANNNEAVTYSVSFANRGAISEATVA